MMRGWLFMVLLALMASACGKDSKPGAGTAATADPMRGRQIYAANCIACHNSDPSKDGSLGPAVKGSSRELLEAKILRATYPPGYTPKRNSTSMPAYPYLKSAIPHLEAFLG